MSIKLRSLGFVNSAARGLVISTAANGTPIVATITTGHRLKAGDRLGIVGVTGMTDINGDWSLESINAGNVSLTGSTSTGTFGGTAVAAVLCDQTPFLPRHSAVAQLADVGANTAISIATVVLEAADNRKADNTEFQYTNSSGVATAGFKSALKTGEIAIPASVGNTALNCMVEVDLARYMTMRASAWTAGSINGRLLA